LYAHLIHPIPTFQYWRNWATELDTCGEYPDPGYVATPYDFGGPESDSVATLLDPSGESLQIPWDAGYGGWVYDPLPNDWLITAADYRLQAPEVGGLPPLSLDPFFTTSPNWSVTYPAIDSTEPPTINRDDFRLEWTVSGAEAVLVQVGLEEGTSGDFVDEFSCAVVDDGEFTLPAERVAAWPDGAGIQILVGRYLPPAGEVSFNGSRSSMTAVSWKWGALQWE
jgi:hypothetical protein